MELPDPVATVLDGCHTDGANHATSSNANVLRYTTDDDRALFLKIQEHPDDSVVPGLAPEHAILCWLDGQLGAPRSLRFHQQGSTQFLVTEACPGQPAHKRIPDTDKPRAVEQMAATLRQIHALPIAGCPFERRAGSVLQHGRALCDSPHLSDEDRTDMHSALDQLRDVPLPPETITFTHGDYCLPNILLADDRSVSGLIDWGYAGLGDPHRDYVAAEFSVARNLGDAWVTPFFDALGAEVDEERMQAHRLLYDLW